MVAAALRTPLGLLLRAGEQHEARMRASGHPVSWYLAAAYVAAGAIAGIAGSLLVVANRYVSPADGGFTTAALVLLAVVIGGGGSLGGALVGAALVLTVRDWLATPVPGHAPLLLGAGFVAAAYLLPTGLGGLAGPGARAAGRVLRGRRVPPPAGAGRPRRHTRRSRPAASDHEEASRMMLPLDSVTRRYGNLIAVDAVSLSLATGERHAIVGPN